METVEALEKTEKIALDMKPFSVKFGEYGMQNNLSRSLLVKVVKTPEIVAASTETRRVFNLPVDPDFMPHVSLIYANLRPEEKQKIIKEIGSINLSFGVNSLHLWKTDGKVTEWYKVKEFSLE